eukprot:2114988-Prymnesium_polylepis.1
MAPGLRLSLARSTAAVLAGLCCTSPDELQACAALPPEELPLVSQLLRKTEANKELNRRIVKRITEQNAYTAVSGDIPKLVTAQDGTNIFLTDVQVAELTQQGRLFCSPALPCRIVDATGANQAGLSPQRRSTWQYTCDAGTPKCRYEEVAAQESRLFSSIAEPSAEEYTEYGTIVAAIKAQRVEGVVFRGDVCAQ